MKFKEFHKLIEAAGWKFDHAKGSHLLQKGWKTVTANSLPRLKGNVRAVT